MSGRGGGGGGQYWRKVFNYFKQIEEGTPCEDNDLSNEQFIPNKVDVQQDMVISLNDHPQEDDWTLVEEKGFDNVSQA